MIFPIPDCIQLPTWCILLLPSIQLPTQHDVQSVYHYHPQHCYTIITSTTDVSVYCSGHHPDCEMEKASEHFELNTNAVQVANIASLCATAKTGSFNLRVVTMVADKLKRLWL